MLELAGAVVGDSRHRQMTVQLCVPVVDGGGYWLGLSSSSVPGAGGGVWTHCCHRWTTVGMWFRGVIGRSGRHQQW